VDWLFRAALVRLGVGTGVKWGDTRIKKLDGKLGRFARLAVVDVVFWVGDRPGR